MTDAYERAKADDEAWEREHDSREKLERDARVIADNLMMYGGKSTFGDYDIIALLDRQAAITRRETRQSWQDAPNVLDRTNLRKIAELQAKVDELNAQNTRLNAKWAEANVRVEKLQAELDHARSCPDCDCCGWKEKVDELQAELVATKKSLGLAQAKVHELQAELDAYDQTHMELPVDAEGVPIKMGDKVVIPQCYEGIVVSIEVGDMETLIGVDGHDGYLRYGNSDIRHVNPRTIEDVLGDAVGELFNANISAGSDEWETVIEKYADELRGMGVCDD